MTFMDNNDTHKHLKEHPNEKDGGHAYIVNKSFKLDNGEFGMD